MRREAPPGSAGSANQARSLSQSNYQQRLADVHELGQHEAKMLESELCRIRVVRRHWLHYRSIPHGTATEPIWLTLLRSHRT
jgi:hypothetical protein